LPDVHPSITHIMLGMNKEAITPITTTMKARGRTTAVA
jgi:hypothetical protein